MDSDLCRTKNKEEYDTTVSAYDVWCSTNLFMLHHSYFATMHNLQKFGI